MHTLLATYVAKATPPTRPDRDFRESPENCGDEDSALQGGQIGFSLDKFTVRGNQLPIETFDPEKRG